MKSNLNDVYLVIDDTITEQGTKHHDHLQARKSSSTISEDHMEENSNRNLPEDDNYTRMKSENHELKEKLQATEKEYQEYRRKQGRFYHIHVYIYIYVYIHILVSV